MSEPYWSALGARAGAGGVDYEGVWSNAVAYLPGDVVLHNGVNYLAVNPSTGVTPGGAASGAIGTALPPSPTDGDTFTLVNSLTAPTYAWRFRYLASIVGTNKWLFIGGSPATSTVDTAEGTGSTSYVDLTTDGPTFTLPVAGQYDIEWGAQVDGASGFDSPTVGLHVNAVEIRPLLIGVGTTDAFGYAGFRHTAAGAHIAKLRYKAASVSVTFSRRIIRVTPVAVAG